MISGHVVWAGWLPLAAGVVFLEIGRREGIWKALGKLALVTYAFWVASVAFFPMPMDEPGVSSSMRINLVPFRDLARSFSILEAGQLVRQHGGNLLLLVPSTLLGPVLWPRLRAWRRALALGSGVSLSIELLQLVFCLLAGNGYRSVDVDDLIVNTAGAMVGYGLFAAGYRVAPRRVARHRVSTCRVATRIEAAG
jgi:glycopeptide antibiotics resistance protein